MIFVVDCTLHDRIERTTGETWICIFGKTDAAPRRHDRYDDNVIIQRSQV